MTQEAKLSQHTKDREPISKKKNGVKKVLLTDDKEDALVHCIVDQPSIYNNGKKEFPGTLG